MKQIVLMLSFILMGTFFTFSQVKKTITVDSKEYFKAKDAGTLDQYEVILDLNQIIKTPQKSTTVLPDRGGDDEKTISCDCYRTPDNTYISALNTCDDCTMSSPVVIPFQFNFYGTNYDRLYINNNGNVTFGNSLSGYSSTAFPSSGNKIIAPFWADVDTRGSGRVVYKVTPTAIFINWENVGYYDSKRDKLNTFQLILSNGNDNAIPDGNNVAFCYRDMTWTTGGASQGVNGFGGIPATAGSNKGDNVAFFQIGRFDHAGMDFDGPLGANDGVTYLSNKSFFFNITGANNIPPIPQGVSQCDTFKLCALGDTADFNILFLSPELNQTTTVTWDGGTLNELFEIRNEPGNVARLTLRAIGTQANIGTYNVSVTATDSYLPAGVTVLNFTIIIQDTHQPMNPAINANITCGQAQLTVTNTPYDTYLWSNGQTGTSLTINQTEEIGVTVSRNKCYKYVSRPIRVPQPVVPRFEGGNSLCPGEDSSRFVMLNFDEVRTVNWGSHPSYNNRDTVYFHPGTYNITVTDTSGMCTRTTPLVITQGTASILPPAFSSPVIKCGTLSYQTSGGLAGTNAVWSSPNPEILFNGTATSTVNNPTITATRAGIYTVQLTTPCGDPIIGKIIFSRAPVFTFPADTICGREFEVPAGTINTVDGGNWLNLDPTNISFSPNEQALYPTITLSENLPLPYELTLRMYDKYCPDLFAERKIVFVQSNVNIPAIQCDLNSWDLQASSYNGGNWTMVNHPIPGYPADSVYKFEFGDSVEIPHLVVKYPGIYTVSYYDNYCDATTTGNIYFPPYIWTQVRDTMVCEGLSFQLQAEKPISEVQYIWNTGSTESAITVSKPGMYSVTIANECYTYSDSAFVTYYMCDIEAPNVISLQSQSGNNVWYIKSAGISKYECTILDRWGNVVAILTEADGFWDGRDRSNKVVSEGVYFYNIKATSIGDINLDKHGFITVIH